MGRSKHWAEAHSAQAEILTENEWEMQMQWNLRKSARNEGYHSWQAEGGRKEL
jgi:hypothetical protein